MMSLCSHRKSLISMTFFKLLESLITFGPIVSFLTLRVRAVFILSGVDKYHKHDKSVPLLLFVSLYSLAAEKCLNFDLVEFTARQL